jgi:hypothetical protein
MAESFGQKVESPMSQNKNFKAGLVVLALIAAVSFQTRFAHADDSAPAAAPAASEDDGYGITHLQPGTEISIPLHVVVPSHESASLGSIPGMDGYGSQCEIVLSKSDENREIDGTFFLTVTSTDDVYDEGFHIQGDSTFNGVPQAGDIYIRCDNSEITVGQFKSLIEKDGGTVRSPGPVSVQQL